MAIELNYWDDGEQDLKKNVKAGHAKVKKGHIILTTPSNQFPRAMPTCTEFATMLKGKIKIR